MSTIDSNKVLEENPFSYRTYKNGNVSISFNNQEVKILKGKIAERFLSQIESKSEFEEQLAMAKITGNFKRGNEREAKQKGK